jgi:hypothetical protein
VDKIASVILQQYKMTPRFKREVPMRYSFLVALLGGLALATPPHAAPPAETRYEIALDLKTYPQSTPKEALASIIKAVENKRVDYLVAQLADPVFVDDRVQRLYGGKFEMQVDDTTLKMDEGTLKLFKRFLKDGQWTTDKMTQYVQLKGVNDRCIYFRHIGERWFIENRNKPD